MEKQSRSSQINRKTLETNILLKLDLDSASQADIDTGLPFFDHMLASFSRHGAFGLQVKARGDLEVDSHHLVEDVGICLGLALKECLALKQTIRRFAHSMICMDDALVTVAVDLGGRSYLKFKVDMAVEDIKGFNTAVTEDFFRALSANGCFNLHIDKNSGINSHHIIEAMFKAVGIALHQATRIEGNSIPSTKGTL
ncbi:MAG: imidazoleglycerol-phosphate dehydratase HisB [Actinomycetota bacterium]|nr:imidazoleglycerol-phosphate dehydratase HisB [Actinomycetota bacterium]